MANELSSLGGQSALCELTQDNPKSPVTKQQLGAGSGKLTREQSSSKAASGKNLTVHLKASTIHSETFPNGALTSAVPKGSALRGA